jgi:hypothetical protein
MAGCHGTGFDSQRVSPNAPATPNRTIRVPAEIWEPAVIKAHDEGTTVTEVVIKALVAFLRD